MQCSRFFLFLFFSFFATYVTCAQCRLRRAYTEDRWKSLARKYNRTRGWMVATRRWDWLITVRRGARDVTGRARVAIGRGRRVEDPNPRRVGSLPSLVRGVREIPGERGTGRREVFASEKGDKGTRVERRYSRIVNR